MSEVGLVGSLQVSVSSPFAQFWRRRPTCVCSLEVALGEVETLEGAHPRTAVRETADRLGITHAKHRPRVAGGGENLPLEILRALSVWLSVLDERGVVTGKCMLRCVAGGTDGGRARSGIGRHVWMRRCV